MRKRYPDRLLAEDIQLETDQSVVQRQRSLNLLKEVYGHLGWMSLDDCVKNTVESFSKELSEGNNELISWKGVRFEALVL